MYRELAAYLAELGYYPHREKSSISFKHDLHNKQMAKIGFGRGKAPAPFFALRFSACRGYSQRFADIVGDAAVRYPSRAARCTDGGCDFCAGDPETHVYTALSPDGEAKYLCGANALAIPNLSADDIEEIKRLIAEENAYPVSYTHLKKVPKLGPKAFEQCAGFLRVPESKNPLDRTGVHPESYKAAEALLSLCGFRPEDAAAGRLAELRERAETLGLSALAEKLGLGVPTLSDICLLYTSA